MPPPTERCTPPPSAALKWAYKEWGVECACLLYSGKFSREKTFTNFKVLWLFVKVFFVKFGGVMSSGGIIGSERSAKVFSVKILFMLDNFSRLL